MAYSSRITPICMKHIFTALIVEESTEAGKAFKRTLNRLGCFVCVVPHGREGIVKCEMSAYDIALVSLSIRDIGARTAVRSIKQICPGTKLFLITSWYGSLDNRVLFTDGIDGVLHKPARFTEIRRALFDHLG